MEPHKMNEILVSYVFVPKWQSNGCNLPQYVNKLNKYNGTCISLTIYVSSLCNQRPKNFHLTRLGHYAGSKGGAKETYND